MEINGKFTENGWISYTLWLSWTDSQNLNHARHEQVVNAQNPREVLHNLKHEISLDMADVKGEEGDMRRNYVSICDSWGGVC